jgi:hypothetical protein
MGLYSLFDDAAPPPSSQTTSSLNAPATTQDLSVGFVSFERAPPILSKVRKGSRR